MKFKEFLGSTDYYFSGAIFIDSNFETHWDSSELDQFLNLLKEHDIADFSISQDLDENLHKQIIVKVDADAHSMAFEYDLTTLMLKHKEVDTTH